MDLSELDKRFQINYFSGIQNILKLMVSTFSLRPGTLINTTKKPSLN